MSRLLITSDLHLGHDNVHFYRKQFSTADEHHEYVYDRLATEVNKADTLYMLGDVAFSEKWLEKVKNIRCKHKKLVCGNHDLDHFNMARLVSVYDSIEVLYSKRNVWWTHCPMHPDEIRRKFYNVHGHTHNHIILNSDGLPSEHYFNACVEHTDYKPITFSEIDEIMKARLNR